MREINFSSMCHIFVISRDLLGHSLLMRINFTIAYIQYSLSNLCVAKFSCCVNVYHICCICCCQKCISYICITVEKRLKQGGHISSVIPLWPLLSVFYICLF